MLIPTILPGELLEGYRGRIATLNGLTGKRSVGDRLAVHLGRPDLNDALGGTFHLLAAAINRMLATELVSRHTLLAVARGVMPPGHQPSLDDELASEEKRLNIYRPVRASLGICRSCIDDDLTHLGFAYWRRNHQIPGVHRCQLHREWLHFAPRLALMNHSPAAPPDASLPTPAASAQGPCIKSLEMFTSLITSIVDEGWLMDEGVASGALIRSAVGLGLHVDDPRWSSQVGEWMQDCFPKWWLDDAVPRAHHTHSTFWRTADIATGRNRRRGSIVGMAMTASVLFRDSKCAIDALRGATTTMRDDELEA